ncbi:hypothetical protein [Streptomyces sp. NPDC058155]|uniref:hypothetical protein n=1 Tax=Streptomyces sp. NPDC058155 TaxID=3346359 RepID=UPI0036F027D2
MSQAPDKQGTHHFILTVQKPLPGGNGFAVADWSGWFTPDPTWTRHDAFLHIKKTHAEQNPIFAGGSVLFFSLEHNQL